MRPRPASAPSRRSGRWPRRSPTWSGRCPTRRSTRRRRRRTTRPAAARTMFVDRVDRRVAETIVDHLEASDASMRVAQLRVLGGAMARVPADATAFAHRERGSWSTSPRSTSGPRSRRVHEAWVDRLRGGAAAGRRRRVRQLPRRRGRGAGPRGLSRARPGTGSRRSRPLRPDQPVPAQPEHSTRGRAPRQ